MCSSSIFAPMKSLLYILVISTIASLRAADTTFSADDVRSKVSDWPPEVKHVFIEGASDGVPQHAMYFEPSTSEPHPLVVFLHPWSGNYTYKTGIGMAQGCIQNGWAYIQPNFRGPNNRPEALGSELAIADIANAVAYARQNGKIDPRRIYLAGASGGGHAAMLAIGRLPGLFAAVSAWVPITDIAAWYKQCRDSNHPEYVRDIEAACQGAPVAGSPSEKEAEARSPLTHLAKAGPILVDLNTGIHDGHKGNSVPISHTILAYNLLAKPEDRFSEADIARMISEEAIPSELLFKGVDTSYSPRKVLLRRSSGNVRVTVTDGKHEIIVPAALAWLSAIDQTIAQKP